MVVQEFFSGDKNFNDEKQSGQPSDNKQLRSLVKVNPQTTVRKLIYELGVTHSTISNYLNKIKKQKIGSI